MSQNKALGKEFRNNMKYYLLEKENPFDILFLDRREFETFLKQRGTNMQYYYDCKSRRNSYCCGYDITEFTDEELDNFVDDYKSRLTIGDFVNV